MTDSVFDLYGQYYDILYQDKDYVSEVNYIRTLLNKYGNNGKNILEFGSGTGKHGRLFGKYGYKVVGVERSIEMVRRAKNTKNFTSVQGDVCNIKLNKKFDAVLSLFHVVSYQITNDTIINLFRTAAEHLKKKGLFIFDIWYSPAVYAQRPQTRIKRIKNKDIKITRLCEPINRANQNCVDVNYNIIVDIINDDKKGIEFIETHSMRHFSIPEIELFARITGFEMINAEEFMTGEKPSEKTWGICITLKRI